MTDVVKRAPQFSSLRAEKIAFDLFEIAGELEPLPSERDQNFKISTSDGICYVLKIANATESQDVLELQNLAMAHINDRWHSSEMEGPVCPQVFVSVDGDSISLIDSEDGLKHFVRLVSYLPGKPLAQVRPHGIELLAGVGRFFGLVDRLLEDFDHPAAKRDFHWDLKQAGKVVADNVELIADDHRRNIVSRFLGRFSEQTLPHLSALRHSIIHNDGNDYNILVRPHHTWSHRISGVIDFGDMLRTVTVAEPAILCAYAMLGKDDPLLVAGTIIQAYHQSNPLTEKELSVLFDLICMRLCASVSLSARQCRLEPDNEYLRISEKPAWRLLEQLAGVHPRLAHYDFRRVCGFDPVPKARHIIDWLSGQAADCPSPVGVDLLSSNTVVLDLSVGSPLISAGEDGSDASIMEQRVGAIMAAREAAVGIGRYNEARLMYTAPHFKAGDAELGERRTIHIGMDFYMAAGSKVVAPLDGTIHSFKNNLAHLDYGPTIILEHQTDAGSVFYTLYGHLSPESLTSLSVGKCITKGECIGSIGDRLINGGWPPHLHFQIVLDMFDEAGNYIGVAPPSGRDLWCGICPDPGILFGLESTAKPDGKRSKEEILAFRHSHLGRNLSISYKRPLRIVRGQGQYLFNDDGRRYLDGVNNVCHVGHCHPHVVAAGQRQMGVLNTNCE